LSAIRTPAQNPYFAARRILIESESLAKQAQGSRGDRRGG